MYEFIFLLKSIAALLITNSHMDSIYPIEALSIGGAIGNCIFFLVSGFCLSSKINGSLSKWMLGRCLRLYPLMWIVNLINMAAGNIHVSMKNVLIYFFLPIYGFWFVAAILIFYFLFYFVIKCKISTKILIVSPIAAYVIIYLTCLDLTRWTVEDSGFFKYIYYFLAMSIGYIFKINKTRLECLIREKNNILLGAVVISGLGYVCTKIMMQSSTFLKYQFLVQLTTLLFAVCIFVYTWSMDHMIKRVCDKNAKIFKAMKMIGNSTLEIYYWNYLIADLVEGIIFPGNLVLAFILIFTIGCCSHQILEKTVYKIKVFSSGGEK